MANQRYEIEIPEEAVQDLALSDGAQLNLVVSDNALTLTPERTNSNKQELSIRRFLVPSFLATIAFTFWILWQADPLIPLTGSNSLATATIVLGEVTGMGAFIRLHLLHISQEKDPIKKKTDKRLAPTLFLSIALIQAFASIALFWAVGYLFQAAIFDRLTATILFFVFISIINYLMVYTATLISTPFMMTLLIITIVCGVLVAMVTNSRQLWWQHNFSFLGTNQAQFAWTFNATLIISGILWGTLIDYLFVPIQKRLPQHRRLSILRGFLTFDALCLLAIGALPNNPGFLHIAHDTAANLLIAGTGLPMLLIYWLLPNATHEFKLFSIGTAISMSITAMLFYVVRYLSLTAFEIIILGLGISWLLLLMQNVHLLYESKSVSYQVHLHYL
ncbi:hypothetical protein FPFC_050080 [Fructobacillus pseudoficulneus]|uniref:Uncharacterized protein n=1 Tax=Fructobacillus pseudoficulneus TaxID=220714 RepID=A0A3F3GYZ7_9LACO|nr:DUF998 domain-containing protein [Fructobacillus pseudoficulneus]GAP03192.1 hypothetical protein FPFC_050080 [Fructobacillus pseudoficulneus]SEH42563.1 Protein of unknown function [Fructobacillus pseudoficulneus]